MAASEKAIVKKSVSAIAKMTPGELFKQYESDATWFRSVAQEGEYRFIRAAEILSRIQKEKLWTKRVSDQTKEVFETFDQWVAEEGGMARGKIYDLLRLKEAYQKVPVEKLLDLGFSRASELARIHSKLPAAFSKAVDKVISRKMPMKEVKVMVANTLANEHLDSGHYTILELSIKDEDYQEVVRALAVAQARTPLENPGTESANGMHIVEICQDYLLDPHSAKVLKELDEAEAFRKNRLTVEE